MITDIFGSLKDNVIRKVKNPFFGTFTIVFVLKNWQLFYSLLFFDAPETRGNRIKIIEDYIANAGGAIWMFGWAVLCTLLILIITYVLLNIGTFISHFSESRISPWVIKVATNGAKVVKKEDHDRLKERYHRTNDKLQEERNKRAEAEVEREKVEKEFAEFKAKVESSNDIVSTNENEVDSSKKSRAEKVVDRIFLKGWDDEFRSVIYKISENRRSTVYIQNREMEEYLIEQQILVRVGEESEYIVTQFAQEVKDLFSYRTA